MLLLTTHLYFAWSVRFRLVMVREDVALASFPVSVIVILELDAGSSRVPSLLSHSTLDFGLPSYRQLRVTFSPSVLVSVDGELKILAGSVNERWLLLC